MSETTPRRRGRKVSGLGGTTPRIYYYRTRHYQGLESPLPNNEHLGSPAKKKDNGAGVGAYLVGAGNGVTETGESERVAVGRADDFVPETPVKTFVEPGDAREMFSWLTTPVVALQDFAKSLLWALLSFDVKLLKYGKDFLTSKWVKQLALLLFAFLIVMALYQSLGLQQTGDQRIVIGNTDYNLPELVSTEVRNYFARFPPVTHSRVEALEQELQQHNTRIQSVSKQSEEIAVVDRAVQKLTKMIEAKQSEDKPLTRGDVQSFINQALANWNPTGQVAPVDHKRIEELILSKVNPEVRSLQRQRDADMRELTGLKEAYTQLEAFIKNDVPTKEELEVAKKTLAELEKKLASTIEDSLQGWANHRFATLEDLKVLKTSLSDEDRKQLQDTFMEAVKRKLVENNGQLTERLDEQLREQLETAIAHIKLSDDRAQGSVDIADIQQIVKDEVAKIKVTPAIDFSAELEHHKEVIQQWIDGTVKGSKPDLATIRDELEKALQSKLGAEVQRLEDEYVALVAQIKALSADHDRVDVDGLNKELMNLKDQLEKVTEQLKQQQQDQPAAKVELTEEEVQRIARYINEKQMDLSNDVVIQLIWNELEKFAADRLNKTDYALESGGARIIFSYTSPSYQRGFLDWLSGKSSESPTVILMPSNALGHCWAFPGSHGFVTIELPQPVLPSEFSLDHVSRGVARDFTSAPQNFLVYGYEDKDGIGVKLGEYTYDINGRQVQTFSVDNKDKIPARGFKAIRLEVLSNYGNKDYTCVYRFRVHGTPATPTPVPELSSSL
ncbi:Secreted beta-glucosidase sun1 [Balamuthia mandrillaris]